MTRPVYLAAMLALWAAAPSGAQTPIGDAEDGAALYATYCSACHGLAGRGDGRMAPILTVLPPDLTGLAAANDGAFPLYPVIAQIDGRDPLLAHGAEMPIFGRWFEGEDVALSAPSGQPILTSRPIADMVAFLQEIQQ